MSAPINPEIQVILRAVDELSSTINANTEAVRSLTTAYQGATAATVTHGQAQRRTQLSMRRVALDLRMISIATAIFRREIGETNPVVDLFSRGLLIVSTTATATMAVVDLLTNANLKAALSFSAVATAARAAAVAVGTFILAHPVIIILAAIAVAIIAIGTALSPATQAARYFRAELKQLERASTDAKLALDVLRYGMEELNITSQIMRIREMEVREMVERRGYATQYEAQLLGNLRANQADVNVEMERQRLISMQTEHTLHGYQMRIEDINRTIKALPSFGFAPGYVPEIEERPPPPPYGQAGAPPTFMAFRTTALSLPSLYMRGRGVAGGRPPFQRAELPEIPPAPMMLRATALDMEAERRTGPISVTISLAGAIISTEIDLQAELRRASIEGAMEIKRRM